MIDFQAPWFSKFVLPDVIQSGELDILQIRCQRDVFLQSFNLIDDTELEFLIQISPGGEYGKLKVIKTRDLFIVEAHVNFEVDNEIQCDENYNFPDDQLLINSGWIDGFKALRNIFATKQMCEILNLSFFENKLQFNGQMNKRNEYEILKDRMDDFGNYLENGHEKVS